MSSQPISTPQKRSKRKKKKRIDWRIKAAATFAAGIALIVLTIMLTVRACTTSKKEVACNASKQAQDSFKYIPLQEEAGWQPPHAYKVLKEYPAGWQLPVRSPCNLREIFNDSNKYQYKYAELYGTKPILDFSQTYMATKPLVKVQSCQFYEVAELTHSLPYLVPRAEMLLRDIGRNFIDSLASRGATGYRIRATSLLRTKATVRKLRRVNINATDSSTHQFGTTFDLSWSNFHCYDSTRVAIGNERLKWLLAEVLEDMRRQGRCLVKYEHKTCCYHITVTK